MCKKETNLNILMIVYLINYIKIKYIVFIHEIV